MQQLLGCEGVDLVFTPEAVKEIAAKAEQINKEVIHNVVWVHYDMLELTHYIAVVYMM